MAELHRTQQGLLPEEVVRGPLDRYSRQSRLRGIGPEGQARLRRAQVVVVGVGALGSHQASTLARAGIGCIWLVDRDVVELDNLQRQLLYTEADAAAGRPKALAAAERLRAANSEIRIEPVCDEFTPGWFDSLDSLPDLILDGTDNFATRFLINDLSASRRVPWIYGGALGAEGAAAVVIPGQTPCLRCWLPEAPSAADLGNCETRGVLASTVAAVAAFQTGEAIKLLVGAERDVARGVFQVDSWRGRYRLAPRTGGPSDDCAVCAGRAYPALDAPPPPAIQLCGRDAVQVRPGAGPGPDLEQLAAELETVARNLSWTPQLLRFEVEQCQFSVFRGGRALLFGVDDIRRARILYDRYVGC